MNFLAIRGQGDPNQEGGAYKTAVGLLFGLAYTNKMSRKGNHAIPGYFDFVVPPLEGLCVQCMHQGPYDNEPATMAAMLDFARESGYVPDHSGARLHHELYLSDPNTCAPEKLRTILRVPVRRK